MKKPFLSLRSKRDVAKLLIAAALIGLTLLVIPDDNEAVAVFAGGSGGNGGSLYGLVGTFL